MVVGRKYFRRGFWSRYTLRLIRKMYFKIVLSLNIGVNRGKGLFISVPQTIKNSIILKFY